MIEGKTVVITGANSGIGKATAMALAKMGASLILLCRNASTAETTRREITERTGNQNVELIQLDLTDFDTVRTAAESVTGMSSGIDVLLNNAGGMFSDRRLTQNGYEYTFTMNHLGHFLLTNLLLPELKAAPTSRIINVSSAAHLQGHLNFNDLMMENGYSGFKAYTQAKLANVIFTKSLTRMLTNTNVSAFSLHPGVVNTNFGAASKGFFKFLIALVRPFMLTPEKGAQTSVHLASEPRIESYTGAYWSKKKVAQHNLEADDLKIQDQLWEVSEKLTEFASNK